MPYKDQDKKAEAKRKWYLENKDAILLKQKTKKRIRKTYTDYNREYYQKNKESIESRRKSRAKPKAEKVIVFDLELIKRNRERLFKKAEELKKKQMQVIQKKVFR